MKGTLEPQCRPGTRAATSLGRLLGEAGAALRPPEPEGRRIRLWSNRRGQDQGETFCLAALVTLTGAGLAGGAVAAWLRPETVGGWLAVALLTVPAFFTGLHLLIFAAAAIEALIRLAGLRPKLPPGHFCGRLFLGLLTAVCLLVALEPGAAAGLKLVAGGWIAVAALNAAAWLVLCLRGLLAELSRLAGE